MQRMKMKVKNNTNKKYLPSQGPRLLALPNDHFNSYGRLPHHDFHNELNPNNWFEEVMFLTWRQDNDLCEYAGVQSKDFLRDKTNAEKLRQDLINDRIPFEQASRFSQIFNGARSKIEAVVNNYQPDIVRTWNADHAAQLGLIVKDYTEAPLVMSVYNPTKVTSTILNADLLICESEELKGICMNQYGMDPDKIRVIHNGIDQDLFKPRSPNEISQSIAGEYANAPHKVLSIGRIVNGKNIESILDAVSSIKPSFPGLVHLHVGAAPSQDLQNDLLELRDSLGLEGTSYFLDHVPKSELPSIYSWADVFVHPSLWEGLSRVLRESLSCGTPVVTTNYGSATEIVTQGHNGLMVNPKDLNEFTGAISQILKDDSLRSKLAANAKPSMKKYNMGNSMRLQVEAYQEILNQPSMVIAK